MFPLAFPFIAGPGALATILLTAGEVGAKPLLFAGFLCVVALVLIVCWVLMLATPRLMKVLGVTGRQCGEPAIRRDSRRARRAIHRRRDSRQLPLRPAVVAPPSLAYAKSHTPWPRRAPRLSKRVGGLNSGRAT